MKGHKFLKVTGILMIIGGALATILGIIAVLSVAALAYIASAHSEAGMLYASTILFLVSGIVELIAGIIGVLNAEKPQKAKVCIVWGCAGCCSECCGYDPGCCRRRRFQRIQSGSRAGTASALYHWCSKEYAVC